MDVVILFFMLGLAAGLLRSELKLPSALYDSLSLVLLLTIGLKGGEGLAQQALGPLLPQLGLVILLCVALTLLAYGFLRRLGRLSRADAAAIAAHYGSVSVATFAVGSNWLTSRNITFEPQLIIFLTVMEVPAIIVGIILARGLSRSTEWRSLAHEAFLGKGVTLLMGGMAIGWIAGPAGLAPVKELFFDLFKGALRDLEKLGVRGYTVTDARGRGSRGMHSGAYDATANIRIEVICLRSLAESAVKHLQAHYYANYAMVAFLQDVEIFRPEKF